SPKLVTINQSGTAPQPILTVTPAERNILDISGTTTFSVSNTGTGTMDWTADSDAVWAVITGDTSGTNSGTISISYEANTSINPRTATITVISIGSVGSPKSVTINQNGTAPQPILTVTPTERNVLDISGTTTFSVSNTGTGTMDWTAASDASWAIITAGSSGTDEGMIVTQYDENYTTNIRTATITVTSDGAVDSPGLLLLNQSGKIPQPTLLELSFTEYFPTHSSPSDYLSTDYRLIGIPGNSSKKINEFLSGTQGESWEVYWDNGNSDNYFIKFDNSNNFLFSSGKAFWLINKGSWIISNVSVSSSPLDAQYLTTISILPNKFNLITNPFMANVAWSDIKAYNQGLTKQPAYWTGSVLGLADTLKPFIGYLLDNTNSALTEIKIPYRTGSLKKTSSSASSWRINIELKSGKYIDKTTVLGVSPEASRAVDKFDMIKPRIMGEMPYLYFDRTDWDSEYSEWGSDIRTKILGIETWDFIAYVKNKSESNIKFKNIYMVPGEFEVYLVDKSTARVQNVRDNPNYSFKPKVTKTNMLVLIGEKKLVQQELEKFIPTEYELLNNYPNPFNPTTTIPVVIPNKSNAILEVYNILGQKVVTLNNGELEPGIHYFEWNSSNSDGKQLSSGVYIYRLLVDNRVNISRKMVLMK
ncbi:MAG: T9SS type A sorting domain-containing protein, partial [Bacteroidetes bacterium]|nr:T9SS type A sorting domain-containing protein [Bacteroidota bacterium]